MADAFSQNVDVSARPRIVLYHQTLHLEGRHVSLLPLLSFSAGITHFIIAALHLNGPRAPNPVHLNDLPPDHPSFDELWQDCAELQRHGTKLLIMLGGAAKGTFALLDGETEMFECQYSLLRQVIVTHCFDGIDLDVEEKMSLRGISRLIDRLRQDFGTSFIISLAPIATAMYGGRNLSGFNYVDLEGHFYSIIVQDRD